MMPKLSNTLSPCLLWPTCWAVICHLNSNIPPQYFPISLIFTCSHNHQLEDYVKITEPPNYSVYLLLDLRLPVCLPQVLNTPGAEESSYLGEA